VESNEDVVNLAVRSSRNNHQTQPILGNHPLVIISQLLQIAGSMRHIDEMFLWLSHMIVQRLGVDVIQFWAMQPATTQQGSPELRATVCRNVALPQHLVVNSQVVEVIERLLGEHRGIMPQAVSTIFPQHQAALLTRYHLNYWASYFLHSNVLLPSANSDAHSEKVLAPLTMIVSLFLQQPPNPRLLPTVGHILEQVIPIARNRGLLFSEDTLATSKQISSKHQKALLSLKDLIPRRVQNDEAMQASNPFSSAVVIPDRQIRQLYLSIDGRKTLAELAAHSQLSVQDFYTALRLLLTQKYIQVYEPGGRLVDPSQIFKNV
jgi:hypothetical protein